MFSPAPEIFKAYDIRGIVGKSLTVETVHGIGQALGSEAIVRGQKSIVIGRDGRLSGPEFATALAEGITSTGIDVIDAQRSLYGAEVVTTVTPVERNRVNVTFTMDEGEAARIKEKLV